MHAVNIGCFNFSTRENIRSISSSSIKNKKELPKQKQKQTNKKNCILHSPSNWSLAWSRQKQNEIKQSKTNPVRYIGQDKNNSEKLKNLLNKSII